MHSTPTQAKWGIYKITMGTQFEYHTRKGSTPFLLFSMPFIRKHLNTSQFLSPAIQTSAIQKLSEYMKVYFSSEPSSDQKPTCVNCFDMSGSGKTTTIMEASKNSNSFRVPISLIHNQLFRSLLHSCKNMGETQDPPLNPDDYISYDKVERYFEKRFQTVLTLLFQCILEKLNALESSNCKSNLIHADCIPPTKPKVRDVDKSLSTTFKELVQKIHELDHLLVIHLDDCQEFFCELTRNVEQRNDGKVKVGEIMGLALGLFSRQVCTLEKCKEILWVFSGTRPNLYLEIASQFCEPYDVAQSLNDFNADNVTTVLGQYFSLQDMPAALKQKMQNLTGPPKLLYWFILAALRTNPESIAVFENQWDKMENMAIGLYEEQIQATTKSFGISTERLENLSRNLALLHTIMLINNSKGTLSFNEFPSKWLPFTEAGLFRIRKEGTLWKLFQPNRFLIKIFNYYIKWFNWENIQDLLANIKASATTKKLKGKVFEYLFALELLAPADSLLWRRLGELMKISPKVDWNPKIEPIGNINSHLDQNSVYVMMDPAREKSKTDVVFFAETIESSTPVRILCQLTTQIHDSTDNAKNSFIAMFDLNDDNIPDYRLVLLPRSSVDLPLTHKQQVAGANCFWLDATTLGSILHFSLDLCDLLKTKDSLAELLNFAVSFNKKLADRIRIPGSLKKRKREFQTMDDFYGALKIYGKNDDQIEKIKRVLVEQEIDVMELSALTDAKLEKCGLIQGGLREAVLSVIENQSKQR